MRTPDVDGLRACLPNLILTLAVGLLAWFAGCAKDGGTQPVAQPPLTYEVTPLVLQFDSVTVADCGSVRSFRVRNRGDSLLSVNIASQSREFEVFSGGGRRQLAIDDSVVVRVRFCPDSAGSRNAAISTGLSGLSQVICTGPAIPIPQCVVIPDTLDFGELLCETCSAEHTVIVTHRTPGIVTLDWYEDDRWPDRVMRREPSIYEDRLGPGESVRIAFRYCPEEVGTVRSEIWLDTAGRVRLPWRGTGLPPDPGACCDPTTGECRVVERVDCTNSCWHWADSTCPPRTACILGMAPCCDPVTAECRLAACDSCPRGWFFGQGSSSCDPNPCPVPVAKSSSERSSRKP